MAAAFLAHLTRPISQMVSPPGDPQTTNPPEGPAFDHPTKPRLGRSNPWLEAAASSATELVHYDSARISSMPVAAQLSSSLRGSSQALGAISESFSQTAALLGISEEQVVNKLKDLSDLRRPPADYSAEYQALKTKLRNKLATLYERRLEEASYNCRAAERKSSELADAARTEIAGLRKMLSDERRANSDLLLALESLRSSGADTSVLKTFLAKKLPSFQKEAYLEAKVCLLKKIKAKYPDADMKYFLDMKEIPGSAGPPSEWLAIPKEKFAYVSSLSAPPIQLSKKRRLH